METIPLRRAGAADSPAVLALVSATLREFGLSPDPTGTDADLADFEANYFASGGDFVVLTDAADAIVGTCGLFPFATPPGSPRTVELRKMYLAPALRGRGQGRRLLEWAITRARELGFQRVVLETSTKLQTAIALYERHGFVREGDGHCCRCDLSYSRDL